MVYTPPSYSGPAAFGPPPPGSVLPPESGEREHVNAYAAKIRFLKHLWYEEHPVCGRFLTCDRACPHYRPVPAIGQLFPHCKHPDITDERYLP